MLFSVSGKMHPESIIRKSSVNHTYVYYHIVHEYIFKIVILQNKLNSFLIKRIQIQFSLERI